MPESAIDIQNVSVTRGGVKILTGVSSTIYADEITAVIGPNGAGKTTLLAAILGLIPYARNGKRFLNHLSDMCRSDLTSTGALP
jgi:ABC-type Mn2+/Zn2+ transport system ATPase subunit